MDINQKNQCRVLIIDDQKSIHEDYNKILSQRKKTTQTDELLDQLLSDDSSDSSSEVEQPKINTDFIECQITSAFQGQEGLKKIEDSIKNNQPYHIAFVDMRMPPGWDGLKTIQEIWKIDSKIQTVICTAFSDYSWKDIVDVLGVSDRLLILKKPFDQMEVLQIATALYQKWILTNETEKIVKEQTEVIKAQEQQVFQAEKLASLGQMAGGIAHEINNPLAIIKNYISGIEKLTKKGKETDIEKLTSFAGEAKKTVDRIAAIVKSMLSLSRNSLEDQKEPLSCQEIINTIISLCEEKSKNKSIPFSLENSLEETDKIQSQGTQISQALLNLLINAFDAVEESHDQEKWVRLHCEKISDSHVLFSIENSGEKISPENINKIFDPFYTTKNIGKGTGLGLALSKKIVQNHQGELFIETEAENTRFCVKRPLN